MFTVHELLKETRVIFNQHGWKTDGYGSPDDGFCLVGALRYASHGTVLRPVGSENADAYEQCVQLLATRIRESGFAADPDPDYSEVTLWRYNDRNGGKGEDVYILLDRLIEETAPVAA